MNLKDVEDVAYSKIVLYFSAWAEENYKESELR
jgi:hypothetical protein